MLKANKSLIVISIFIFALIIATSFVLSQNYAYAQNESLVVDLNETSKFDVYNDIFAFTFDNSLYIADDDKIYPFPNAFTGNCIGLVINDKNILVLAKDASTYTIYYFDYDDHGIKSAQSKLGILSTLTVTKLFKDEQANFYFAWNYSTDISFISPFKENLSDIASISGTEVGTSYQVQEYAYHKDSGYVYALIGGEIYRANFPSVIDIKPSSGNEFVKVTTISNASSISCFGTEVFANTTSGIFKFDISTLDASASLAATAGTGKIVVSEIESQKYVFICENNAITQYLYDGTTCSYFNKFNNNAYVAPTTFDLLYVAKLTSTNCKMYTSPRNMQEKSSLNQGDYFLVLTRVENADSGTYYYIAKADGTTGYIKDSTEFTQVAANTDARSLKIGLYAQGLFPTTTIYKYPYPTSETLLEIEGYDELVVISNVAQDGNTQVWNYYQVSYVKDGEIFTGYVKVTDVSPYTSLVAPTVLKTVKISTGSIGAVVYLYALPSEESTQIATLTDGEELDLAEEYNKNSTWTKVIYKDTYAYVLTSQISQKGLTAVQITLIVISSIVVVVSIVMGVLMSKKRKIGF